MPRGRLRVYLGAAPGVGKTYAMLREGRRLLQDDIDVVVAVSDARGRKHTVDLLTGLEAVPPARVGHQGVAPTEMDVAAVLGRRPRVALVDELAHTNATGSRNRKRWLDVQALLEAGIDVISTVNIQDLESLKDVIEAITGVTPVETVPDAVVRGADEVELVDLTTRALRHRVAQGHVYPAEQVDDVLANYFRPGNLTALRELALLWLADRVDEALERYRRDHGIQSTWPARERVVVALTGGPEGHTLLRRGARIASRGAGGELIAVYVGADSEQSTADPGKVTALRQMTGELGGQFHSVTGDDVPQAILDFARSVNASQIVIGASSRPRWRTLLSPGTGAAVVARSGDVDVHLVTHEFSRDHQLRTVPARLSGSRLRAGWLMAVLGPALLTALLLTPPVHLDLRLIVQLFLAYVVLVALVGGLWPAVVTAVLSSLAFNWFFTHPRRTWAIDEPQDAAAIFVFLVVAVAVASVVHLNVRRTEQAVHAQRDSLLFGELANSLLASPAQLDLLLSRAASTFGSEGAAVVRTGRDRRLDVVARCGHVDLPDDVDNGRVAGRERIDEEHELLLVGPVLSASNRRLLTAYAANASAILTRHALLASTTKADTLARDNRARTALLSAVSHDLRTPLAGIKAAASGLRDPSVQFSPADQQELMRTIEECSDELDGLISDLLDVSRLQAGALTAHPVPIELADALPDNGWPARVRVEPALARTTVLADRGLLERVVANLVDNALAHGGPDATVDVAAVPTQDRVRLIVRDDGPGVPQEDRAALFAPFQRHGDDRSGNLGLGLAVAHGLVEAMGGTLTARDTPGGGLTMVVDLAAVTAPGHPEPTS